VIFGTSARLQLEHVSFVMKGGVVQKRD